MTTKRDHTATLQGVLRGEGLAIPDDDIYSQPLHEKMPATCIFMVPTGGPPAQDTFGPGGEAIQTPTVQVRVRHEDNVGGEGKEVADDVWALIHDMDEPDYSPPTMRNSGPQFIGVDGDGRYEWAINVELYITE